jgi:hypothetical protein
VTEDWDDWAEFREELARYEKIMMRNLYRLLYGDRSVAPPVEEQTEPDNGS